MGFRLRRAGRTPTRWKLLSSMVGFKEGVWVAGKCHGVVQSGARIYSLVLSPIMASATRFISLPNSGSEAQYGPRSNKTHFVLQHDTDLVSSPNSVKQNTSRRGSRGFWVRRARQLYRIIPEAAFFHGLRGVTASYILTALVGVSHSYLACATRFISLLYSGSEAQYWPRLNKTCITTLIRHFVVS